jgi:hypothetical protein
VVAGVETVSKQFPELPQGSDDDFVGCDVIGCVGSSEESGSVGGDVRSGVPDDVRPSDVVRSEGGDVGSGASEGVGSEGGDVGSGVPDDVGPSDGVGSEGGDVSSSGPSEGVGSEGGDVGSGV